MNQLEDLSDSHSSSSSPSSPSYRSKLSMMADDDDQQQQKNNNYINELEARIKQVILFYSKLFFLLSFSILNFELKLKLIKKS